MNEEQSNKNLNETIACLNQSATFAMSRGGRELFHTNFLAHILEIETNEANQTQSPFALRIKENIIAQLFDSEPKPKNIIAFRERKNLDLILISEIKELEKVREIVVVEAKLKSIPSREQLDKYNKLLEKTLTLDLFDEIDYEKESITEEGNNKIYRITKVNLRGNTISLIDSQKVKNSRIPNELKIENFKLTKKILSPQSTTSEEVLKDSDWSLLNWSNFLVNLNTESLQPLSLLDSLVNDYTSSTKRLLSLVDQNSEMANSFIDKKKNFGELYDYINNNVFKKARLHDLVGKVIYFKLQESFKNPISDSFLTIQSEFKFDSYTFYSRSTPGIVLQYKKVISEKISVRIGVQIQGDSYRHFIEREGLDNSKPSLDECASMIRDWMKCSNNGFNAFNRQRFLHVPLSLSRELDYDGLRKMVINSLNEASDILKSNENNFIEKLVGTFESEL